MHSSTISGEEHAQHKLETKDITDSSRTVEICKMFDMPQKIECNVTLLFAQQGN